MMQQEQTTETPEDKSSNKLSALQAWRAEGGVPERLTPVERSKRNPNSKALAIKAYCWDCSGGSAQEAKLCEIKKCSLYAVNPYKKHKSMLAEQDEDMLDDDPAGY